MLMRVLRAATVAACLCSPTVAAEKVPGGPITFVVPYTPGGFADAHARIEADFMSRILGTPVLVDNRPGASGLIGAKQVAQSAPDGRTLFYGVSSLLVLNPIIDTSSDFDSFKNLDVVSRTYYQPYFLIVRAEAPFATLADLIARAKQKPGEMKFGSIGVNTSHHVSGEMLADLASLKLVHVPYKGAADILPDLVTGRIDFTFGLMSTALANPDQTRPLCILATQRSKRLPAVPPCGDTVPGLVFAGWGGIQVAAKTPPEVLAKLDAAIKIMTSDPAFVEQVGKIGAEANYLSTADWNKTIIEERAAFQSFVDRRKLKAQ
jgi:tripartite-type tricarboxylate transporter receptor subunit TctC